MKLLSWTLLAVLLFACKAEIKVSPADLTGKWNFAYAMRNGKETKMLNQAFFVFHPDKSVTSNLFQSDESKTFEIANNILSMSGQEAFKMEIVDFKRDTMQLEGKMGDFDMQFMLVKAQ
ncbi:MAG: hypothetical protein KBF57_06475 [Saprospiraceae bacterium]|jgi:hypothetical protein|nr:hypothetical protein [Saprospiraceae bacterium]MBP9194312.1 hypothetical protein [Saprospiraceae bacterium]